MRTINLPPYLIYLAGVCYETDFLIFLYVNYTFFFLLNDVQVFLLMFGRFEGDKEYCKIPVCSVLSCLIVLLRPYTSPGAIFTIVLIFLQL